ncbi:MAG: family 10 glycosylhydrolase, partial [Cyanobacteria bacterium REEB459]|nr:family 10 glycosylhydrolase [Cyanobacteria bacterium REEB459]
MGHCSSPVWKPGRFILCFALALSFILGSHSPLLAARGGPALLATEISPHWAAACLTVLVERGLMGPDQRGRLDAEGAITWAEYVTLLNNIVPPAQAGAWANPLEQALGLINPPTVASHYPSDYYNPNRPVWRQEAVMALAAKRGSNHEIAANSLIKASLQDGDQVSAYLREGVAAALAQGLVVNYPRRDQLRPTQPLSRGEAAALACRLSPDPALTQTINPDWVATVPATVTVTVPRRELRGVWLTNIDSQVLFSTQALTQAINQLADLNFNTLYPTVWNWGYTLYPSPTAQRQLGMSQYLYGDGNGVPAVASPGDRDMLQEAIDLGHARGMAVIPWFEFGFMAPANYELYRRHPDWFTQRQPLSDSAPGSDDPNIWLEGNVLPRRWLNPFHPQAQKFILELINDLVSNYAIDGFQFDDHLGLPVEFGYDPYTINLYRAEHGGRNPPTNPQDQEWVAWRAAKISDFLGLVYSLVKSRRPQAVVSISPNPYPFAYDHYLQDWPAWVKRGLVDELVIQIYRSDQNRFIWEVDKPSIQAALAKIPTSAGLLSGLRADPVSIQHLEDQIEALRDRRLAGMSFFFYESLWLPSPEETREQRLTKLRQALSQSASRP